MKIPGVNAANSQARLFALLAVLCALCSLSARSPRRATAQTQPQPTPAPLTEQERRGRAIYLRGESASGRELRATLACGIDLPASAMTCANCHGERGEGKTEGGVTAGNLQWSNLTKPDGHTHTDGRRHGAFDAASFVRATVEGIDPAGNKLQPVMPRYELAAEDAADLVAYIKRVETAREPGVTDAAIGVGMLVPAKGALAETGQAMRSTVAAYFEDLNSRGGINDRKIELRVAEAGDTPAATSANLEQFVAGGQVFALVSSMTAGADREIASAAAARGVPLVGAISLTPLADVRANRQVFYLTPGVAEQSRALVNFAARKFDKTARSAVVYTQGDTISTISAEAVEAQSKLIGWSPPTRVASKRGLPDPSAALAAAVAELKNADTRVVYLFGADAAALLAEAAKLGWYPQVYLLGVTAGAGILDAPAGFKDRIFLAFPTVPSDITPAGLADYRALAQKYALASDHVAARLSALAAARVFVEGLKRAGRDLTRERLVAALEGLFDFETGLTPRVTFSPNRRVGALGAYVVGVDLEKKQYAVASGWIGSER
ncbi:MAG: ABC transporter substrate-binding protein [Acidobacteria bacterium]|nr:ABC transporter substrate-binding protein [Acidobacteriota bacterium]